LIDILGLSAVVVPPDPGNLSAYGLLTVDVRNDDVQTAVQRDADLDLDRVAAAYQELERRSTTALAIEGFHARDAQLVRSADLRYDGQAYEVRVDAPAGAVDSSFQAAVVEAFHAAHERLYGYCYRGIDRHAVEWVNLRVTGIGPIARPELEPQPDGDGDVGRARTGERRVHFEEWTASSIYDRSRLRPGDVVVGPAVVEEFGSTVPVHAGYVARVDAYLDLVVSRA
jgi:N-methylhydantoinase A